MENQVLQLLDTPYKLNPNYYKNAYSSVNPEGNYQTAYNLKELVDRVPQLTRIYLHSDSSIESNYGLIVDNAKPNTTNGLISNLIASAKERFSEAVLENIDGLPGTWRAVDATPNNWMEPNVAGYREGTINFKRMRIKGLSRHYTTIKNRQVNEAYVQKKVSLSDADIKLRLLEVSISRSWLDMTLFKTPGWVLQGQHGGYVSTGNIDDNDGILPLIITGFIVGYSIDLTSFFENPEGSSISGGIDIQASSSHSSPLHLSVNIDSSTHPYLLGFTSQLVPASPTIDG